MFETFSLKKNETITNRQAIELCQFLLMCNQSVGSRLVVRVDGNVVRFEERPRMFGDAIKEPD